MNGQRQPVREESTRNKKEREGQVGAEKPKPEGTGKKVLLPQPEPELSALTSSYSSALSQNW